MKINPYKRFRYAITNLLHEGGSAYKKILKKRVHSKNSNPKLKQQNSNKPDNEHVSIINDLNLSAQNIIDNDETISVERLIDSLEVVNADEKITTVDISEKLILEQIEISREVITEQPVDTNESGLVNDKSIEEITLVKESITLNKTNLKDIEMTTVSGEDPHLPKEFEYLKTLVSYRLSNPGGSATPQIPPVSSWDLPVKEFILKHELNNDVAALILIGLVPHIIPELFDETIQKKIKSPTDDNDYPELGGIRGKNFRGFLPTGQTAIFLLAGNNWKKRFEIEQLFWSDKELAIKKILWLEQLEQGEPVASGKITIALDYVELFLYGTVAPPHFSTSFPAKKLPQNLR